MAKAPKPVGQTGFYAFGGNQQSLLESHPVESLQGRPAFPDWTVSFGTFYDQGSLLGAFDLKSTIDDPYGSQFATPQPGGMYTPSVVNNMLRRMEVKVVGGQGHEGNSDGGLVPWNVNVPVAYVPGEVSAPPGSPIDMCDWLQIYHGHIAEAFRDWYVKESSFCSIGPPQTPTWPFSLTYEWAMEGVYHDKPGNGRECSPVPHAFNNRDIERWFHGDSNCALANQYPVQWDPAPGLGLGNNMTQWESYVTKFAGQLPSRSGEQGRETAAWYCPNWTNSAAFTHYTVWRPHSIYQIVFWLLHGAETHFGQSNSAAMIMDPYYGNGGPQFSTFGPHNAFKYPKSNLGQAHGRQILTEFMNWWNSNWDSYGPAPSRSHLGVFLPGWGGTTENAIANDHGNPWNTTAWFAMIGMLYGPCLGSDKWVSPSEIAGWTGLSS